MAQRPAAGAETAIIQKEAVAAVNTTVAPAAQAALAVAKAAASAVPADKLSARVGSSAWDQQLGQKIVYMAAGGDASATLELNPPDLGPLQVVLSVSKDQATAAFSSAVPEVRQALESALPKLKEMMSEAGIQLGNATVSSGMSDQGQAYAQASSSDNSGRGSGAPVRYGASGDSGDASAPASPPVRRSAAGAVDIFA
jgi:flagellar hook-length control protein FliK